MDLTSWQTSLRDLLLVVFRRRWSVLTIVLGGLIGVTFWMFFIHEDTYEATAKILVKIGHEQSSSTVGSSSVLITGERAQDVNSEVDVLQSTDLLAEFVDRLGLDRPAPPTPPPAKLVARIRFELRKVTRLLATWKEAVLIKLGFKEPISPREAVIDQLHQRLLVDPERNSNVITIHLGLDQRQNAGVLLNKLLELYLTFRLGVYSRPGAQEFFTREVADKSKSLQQSEQELRAFEDQWNISAIAKQKEVLLDQIAEAQTALTAAEIDFQEASDRVRRAETEGNSQEPDLAAVGAFPANSFPATLLAELATLQRERESLRMTELDSGLRISNNRKQFQVLTEMLMADLKSSLAEKQSAYEERKQALADLQNRLRTLQDREAAWNALKRKVNISEDSFLTYGKKMEDAKATESLEQQNIGSVAILEHAIDPVAPIGISKIRILELTLLLVIFAAVAWLSIAEYLDHRVYEPDELEKYLAAPVLEVVAADKSKTDSLWPSGGPEADDTYRRAALELANPGSPSPLGIVFFSGVNGAEGATRALLAVSLHLSKTYGNRTLVMELCNRSLSVNGSRPKPSETTEAYAAGKLTIQQCIQQHESGVSILPALFSTDHRYLDPLQLRKLLEEVRPGFDFVLVDAPPVFSPDCLPVLKTIKNAVLVLESGRIRSEVLERMKQELAAENVSLVGTIFTNHKPYIPAWIYRWLLQ
jgi:uncharacterized protein involved in exopolysaccharide biosynthesis/Mrp family chromosome partitioning ATPase